MQRACKELLLPVVDRSIKIAHYNMKVGFLVGFVTRQLAWHSVLESTIKING